MIARAISSKLQARVKNVLVIPGTRGQMCFTERGTVNTAVTCGTEGGELIKCGEQTVLVDAEVLKSWLGSHVRKGGGAKSINGA